jgi:maltose alpha-D-glucosyltransferase/alpha-amylase
MAYLEEDPLWYKDAVIYELHVKAFCDSNGDGIGDFQGLTEKLPYIEDLGITAIWLLPFYPSPLKDDGSDIADYFNVLPDMHKGFTILEMPTSMVSALPSLS